MPINVLVSRFGLYLFLFLINFESINLTGNGERGLSVSWIAAVMYLAISVVFVPFKPGRMFFRTAVPLLLMFTVIAISGLLSANAFSARAIDLSVLQCVILFLLVLLHVDYDPEALPKAFEFFAAGAGIVAILAALGYGIEFDTDNRMMIFGDNQNSIGFRMAIAASVIMHMFLSGNVGVVKKIAFGILLPVIVWSLVGTASRGSAAALAGAIVILYLSQYQKPGRFALFSVIGFVGVLASASILQQTTLFGRFSNAYYNQDIAGRDTVWLTYLEQSRLDLTLLIGHGYSGFDSMALYLFGELLSPHNVMIEVFLLGGIIGALIFIYFNFLAFRSAWAAFFRGKEALPMALLFCYGISLMTGQTLNVKIFWLVIAFCFTRLAQPVIAANRQSMATA